jgi:hypothetical protein
MLNLVEPAPDVVISPALSFSIARSSALYFWRTLYFARGIVFRPVSDSFLRTTKLWGLPEVITHYSWVTGNGHECLSSERSIYAAVKAEMSTFSMSIRMWWERMI